ncbi:uncharacterized protein LOC117146748 [Drosophila mauritiana]|uniref:Uncharacterized protein LOC117146748 n=1 Tax=Drosophila mauritiana TaxID=7226 RepID=A0A6P8KI42_DROMA|nr:uncharacterized protein LOC117146748 [Drosophila mauritiana]
MKVWIAQHLFVVILVSSAVPLTDALGSTVCADRFNGLSFADPASCSSFFVCQRGNAVRRECSNGLFYDPKIQTCNLPGLVKCFNGDRGGAVLGDVKANVTLVPDGKAKEEATATTTQTTTCPPTTTVTPAVTTKKSKLMLDAEDADDAHSMLHVTPYPLSNRIDVLRSQRDCRGINDGEYLTDPKHCRRFYMCHKNRVKRHNCPRNQWFDRETKSCQDRELVLNCPVNRN